MEVFKLFATLSLQDSLSKPLTKIQSLMQSTNDNIKQLSDSFTALAKTMSPVASVASSMVAHFARAAEVINGSFQDIMGEINALTASFTTFAKSMSAVTTVAQSVTLSFTYSVVAMKASFKDAKIEAEYLSGGILSLSKYILPAAQSAFKHTKEALISLGDSILALCKSILPDMRGLLQSIQDKIRSLSSSVLALGKSALSILKGALQGVLDKVRSLSSGIINLGKSTLSILKGALQGVLDKVRSLSSGIINLGKSALSILKGAFQGVQNKVKSFGGSIMSIAKSVLPDMQGKFDGIKNKIKSFGGIMMSVGKVVLPAVQISFQNTKNKIKALGESAAMLSDSLSSVTPVAQSVASHFFNATKRVADMQDSFNSMSGATDNLATAQGTTLNGAMGSITESMDNISIVIGKTLLPIVTTIAKKLEAMAKTMEKVADTPLGKTLIFIVAGAVVAVLVLAKLAATIVFLTTTLPAIIVGLKAVGASLLSLAWPMLLIIAVVGLVYLAWKNNIGGIADIIKDKFSKIILVIRGVVSVFRTMKNGVGEIRGELAEDVSDNGLVGIITTISKVIYRVYKFCKGFAVAIKAIVLSIVKDLEPVGKFILRLLTPIGMLLGALGSLIARLFNAGAATDVNKWESFGKIIAIVLTSPLKILSVLLGVVATGFNAMLDILCIVKDVFFAVFSAAFNIIGKILNPIDSLKDLLLNLFDIDLAESGRKLIASFVSGITSMIKKPAELVAGALSMVRNLLPFSDAKEGPLSTLTLSGSRVMTTLAEGVSDGSSSLSNATSEVFDNLPNISTSGLADIDLLDLGKSAMSTYVDGVSMMALKPVNIIKNTISKVKNLLPVTDENEGIISNLASSGVGLITKVAGGVVGKANTLRNVASNLFDNLPNISTSDLADIDLLDLGKSAMSTYVDGVSMMALKPVNIIKNTISKVKNLLPVTDENEGIISNLASSGVGLITKVAGGVVGKANTLHNVASNLFDNLPSLSASSVADIDNGDTNATGTLKGRSQSSGNTVIHIANISLPNVDNPQTFIATLEQIALQGGRL